MATAVRTLKTLIPQDVYGDILLQGGTFTEDNHVITKRFLNDKLNLFKDDFIENDLKTQINTNIRDIIDTDSHIEDRIYNIASSIEIDQLKLKNAFTKLLSTNDATVNNSLKSIVNSFLSMDNTTIDIIKNKMVSEITSNNTLIDDYFKDITLSIIDDDPAAKSYLKNHLINLITDDNDYRDQLKDFFLLLIEDNADAYNSFTNLFVNFVNDEILTKTALKVFVKALLDNDNDILTSFKNDIILLLNNNSEIQGSFKEYLINLLNDDTDIITVLKDDLLSFLENDNDVQNDFRAFIIDILKDDAEARQIFYNHLLSLINSNKYIQQAIINVILNDNVFKAKLNQLITSDNDTVNNLRRLVINDTEINTFLKEYIESLSTNNNEVIDIITKNDTVQTFLINKIDDRIQYFKDNSLPLIIESKINENNYNINKKILDAQNYAINESKRLTDIAIDNYDVKITEAYKNEITTRLTQLQTRITNDYSNLIEQSINQYDESNKNYIDSYVASELNKYNNASIIQIHEIVDESILNNNSNVVNPLIDNKIDTFKSTYDNEINQWIVDAILDNNEILLSNIDQTIDNKILIASNSLTESFNTSLNNTDKTLREYITVYTNDIVDDKISEYDIGNVDRYTQAINNAISDYNQTVDFKINALNEYVDNNKIDFSDIVSSGDIFSLVDKIIEFEKRDRPAILDISEEERERELTEEEEEYVTLENEIKNIKSEYITDVASADFDADLAKMVVLLRKDFDDLPRHDVINSLYNDSKKDGLSALQGKILKEMIDEKVDMETFLLLESRVLYGNESTGESGLNDLVYDGLDSSSYSRALSANQGRILNNKITYLENELTSTSTNLQASISNEVSTLNASINDLRSYTDDELDKKVSVSDIVNDLISNDTDKPLSALQGNILNESIINLNNRLNAVVSGGGADSNLLIYVDSINGDDSNLNGTDEAPFKTIGKAIEYMNENNTSLCILNLTGTFNEQILLSNYRNKIIKIEGNNSTTITNTFSIENCDHITINELIFDLSSNSYDKTLPDELTEDYVHTPSDVDVIFENTTNIIQFTNSIILKITNCTIYGIASTDTNNSIGITVDNVRSLIIENCRISRNSTALNSVNSTIYINENIFDNQTESIFGASNSDLYIKSNSYRSLNNIKELIRCDNSIIHIDNKKPFNGLSNDVNNSQIFDGNDIIFTDDIVNTLSSNNNLAPLSASQGKILNESKVSINSIVNNLSIESDELYSDIDGIEYGYVLDARQGKILNDNKINYTNIKNNLISDEDIDKTQNVLSAYQGYVLNELINNKISYDNIKDSLELSDNVSDDRTINVLSAYQGYVLDQKINNINADFLQVDDIINNLEFNGLDNDTGEPIEDSNKKVLSAYQGRQLDLNMKTYYVKYEDIINDCDYSGYEDEEDPDSLYEDALHKVLSAMQGYKLASDINVTQQYLVDLDANLNERIDNLSSLYATDSIYGFVKIGENINVDQNQPGYISVSTGSTSIKGVLSVGNNITVNNGQISLTSSNIMSALNANNDNSKFLSADGSWQTIVTDVASYDDLISGSNTKPITPNGLASMLTPDFTYNTLNDDNNPTKITYTNGLVINISYRSDGQINYYEVFDNTNSPNYHYRITFNYNSNNAFIGKTTTKIANT